LKNEEKRDTGGEKLPRKHNTNKEKCQNNNFSLKTKNLKLKADFNTENEYYINHENCVS
jgi:hypothetical protein